MRLGRDLLQRVFFVFMAMNVTGCGDTDKPSAPAAAPEPVPPPRHVSPAPPVPEDEFKSADPSPQKGDLILSPAAQVALDRLLERTLPSALCQDVLRLLARVDEAERVNLLHATEALFTSKAYATVNAAARLASLEALTVVAVPEWPSLIEALGASLPGRSWALQEPMITAAVTAPTDRVVVYLEAIANLVDALPDEPHRLVLARTLARVPGAREAPFWVATQLLWLIAENQVEDHATFSNSLAYLLTGSWLDPNLPRYLDALLGVDAPERGVAAAGLAAFVASRRPGSLLAETRGNFLLGLPRIEFATIIAAVAHFFDVPERPDVLDDILRLHDNLWASILLALAQRGGDVEALHVLAAEPPDEQAEVLQAALGRLRGAEDRLTGEVLRLAASCRREP